VQPEVLTTTGLVGLVVLVLSGLGWIAALRDGIQAVFGAREGTNFIVLKLFDLVLLVVAGFVVLTSVAVSVAVNVASGDVLDLLDIARAPLAEWAVNVLGQLALVVLDTVVFTLLFSRLCGVGVPLRDLVGGAFLAAVGFTGLKLFATELLRLISHNRFLAASGLLVGLLVWMNLLARLLLVAAAWAATVAADRGRLDTPDLAAPLGVAAADPSHPAPMSDGASAGASPGRVPEVARGARGSGARRAGRMLLFAGVVAAAVVYRFVTRRPGQAAGSARAAPRSRAAAPPRVRGAPDLRPAAGRPPATVRRPSHREPAHQGTAGHRDDERGDEVDGA
jgi:membrane protein